MVTYLQNNAAAGNSYTVTFVSADDGVIFGDGSITRQITINQRVITESSIAWPRATDITYGQAACDSDLVVDDPKEDNKYGTFIWGEDAICSPGVGNYGFNVDFVLTDTNCRTADGGDTITHKVTLSVKPAELNTLTLSTASVTYQEVDFLKDGTISASSVTATNGDKLKAGEYSLTVKLGDDVVTQVIDAGTYTVVAMPKNSNYSGSSKNTFVVNPAVLDRLVLGQNTSVYDTNEVSLTDLAKNAHLYAGTVEVPSGKFTLAAYDPNDMSSKTVQNAGTYKIMVKSILGTDNFTYKYGGTPPSATYTVPKAEVSSIVLDTSSSVYTAAPVNADSLKATVYATDGNNNKFVMPESAYKLQFQLPPEEVILPRTYAVYVELKDTTNYYKNGDGPSADYEVTKAPVTSFELTTKAITYNGKEVDLANLTAVVKAGNLTLKHGTDYELVYAGSDKIMNANTYAIGIEIKNTTCYSDPDKKTDTFTVRPASLNDFNLNDVGSTYDREVVDPDTLDATVKAEVMVDGQKVPLTLNRKDFVLTANKEIKDAGTYSITIDKLKNTNYTLVNAGVLPQTYTVDPAPVASFALTTRSSVYDGNEVIVGDLSATVTAGDNGGLTLEDREFALKNSGANPIKDADSYVIGFELTSDNFTMTGFNGPVTDTYTVKPAPLFSFSLDVDSSVYDRNTVAPNSLKATVTAGQNGALTLNRSDFELTCAETIRDAKTYDIGILKLNNANYTLEGTVRDVTLPYTVNPAPVESVAVNPGYSCFNQKEVALSSLSATVKANGLTLNDDEYTLTCDDQIVNVGRYTIGMRRRPPCSALRWIRPAASMTRKRLIPRC